MNNNPYSEFAEVAGTNIHVFALQLEDGKIVWSIGSKQNGIGVEISDSSTEAVDSLKRLKKQIDGAIKFMNDKQKEIHDETAK
jgi:prefoldin subunit 5